MSSFRNGFAVLAITSLMSDAESLVVSKNVNEAYANSMIVRIHSRSREGTGTCREFLTEGGRLIALTTDIFSPDLKLLMVIPREMRKCGVLGLNASTIFIVRPNTISTVSCGAQPDIVGQFMELEGLSFIGPNKREKIGPCVESRVFDRREAFRFIGRLWVGANAGVLEGLSGLQAAVQ